MQKAILKRGDPSTPGPTQPENSDIGLGLGNKVSDRVRD